MENLDMQNQDLDELLGDSIADGEDSLNEEKVSELFPIEDGSKYVNIDLLKILISKYYMGGTIDSALYDNSDKLVLIGVDNTLTIYCKIESRSKVMDYSGKFGIFNTSQVLSLLNLLSGKNKLEFLEDHFTFTNLTDEVNVELNIADESVSENYKLPNPEKLPKEYEMVINLGGDFIDKALTSIKALSKEKLCYFHFKKGVPYFSVGDKASKSNKINLNLTNYGEFAEYSTELRFLSSFVKNMFESIKNSDKVTIKLSVLGLMVVEATDENGKYTYYLGSLDGEE